MSGILNTGGQQTQIWWIESRRREWGGGGRHLVNDKKMFSMMTIDLFKLILNNNNVYDIVTPLSADLIKNLVLKSTRVSFK